MTAGHLQIKNGYYYVVLSYKDTDGKRKQPWIPTGLPTKGNKKRAEKALMEIRKSFTPPIIHVEGELSADMLFSDYMMAWLEIIRTSIAQTTYASYSYSVLKKIVPYFKEKGITLGELQAKHIQGYYLYELKQITASSVIRLHANIHKALKYAVKMDLIPSNPAEKVERPKKNRYIANYYQKEEIEQLLEVSKSHYLSLLIQMTVFYGLRRSEVLGLKWDAIDFENNRITIKHIVSQAVVDGKHILIQEDRAKTKSSLRSLPLVNGLRDKLMERKAQQEENKKVCGNCYNYEYDGYVFVDAMGNIFKPEQVSDSFRKLLKQNGLKQIRFHDLRHSCASLLLANNVPMKQIQEWLGHSDMGTTANIYSHLDYHSKIDSANVMDGVLSLPNTVEISWNAD